METCRGESEEFPPPGSCPVSRSNAQTPKVTGLWKTMWAGLILDDSRIVRYEHGVTA